MYTREEFARRLAESKRVESREGWVLAAFAVPFGLAQLVVIRWADAHLARQPRLALEGGVFLAYMAVVGALVWRMIWKSRAHALACPLCGVRFEGDAGRAALVTGRCGSCGGDVIAPEVPPAA